MDSRLLNVVYDDPFDGNYAKYDNDTEFWSSGSDTMGMQLTETLHGILPMAPSDDFGKDDNTISLQNNKSSFSYEEFAGQHLASGGDIEIVTIDPNINGYDTDSEGAHDDLIEFDRQSQYSNLTFRTRTDSSSIGDYESHTSDYDDDEDDDDDNDVFVYQGEFEEIDKPLVTQQKNSNESSFDIDAALVTPDNLIMDSSYHKNRTISTNSDVDGLGLNIDANNFDLAEFITKDDFTINTTANTAVLTQKPNKTKLDAACNSATQSAVVQVISSKSIDSDSDSDVIVDVETVEADDDEVIALRKASELLKPHAQIQADEDITYVDNITTDPSWCPGHTGKKAECVKSEQKSAQKQNFTRNLTLVPNKKQCDILKGKFGKGKATKPGQKTTKNKQNECLSQTQNQTTKTENSARKMGIGMGGKNLALLKHERVSISEQSSEDNNTPQKVQQQIQQIISPVDIHEDDDVTHAHKAAHAVKRKLNLEEYKKRRGDPPTMSAASSKVEFNKLPKLESSELSQKSNNDKKPLVTSPTKHSEAVTLIVKSLKEKQNQQPKTASDPITEAKNKVLRMQELKRAQQMRIIDSKISAKVPRVTKLLPLCEIVKDTPYLVEKENNSNATQSLKTRPEYEEIIIVSASCNTDVSIPPLLHQATQPVNKATRSLLKSSALLSTISNTFQKVKATEHGKISSNSLIASIQDVVVKKTLPLENNEEKGVTKDQSKPEHHGEDKVIMHLRKDRIRKRTSTIGTQTDLQPEFPSLPLPKSAIQHISRERRRKHRKRQYRKHKETSSPIASEYSSDEQSDHSKSSSVSRSRDNSSSSSLERMRTYDSAIGTGGYSSRSSRKHRSSISSSYSESVDRVARGRRQRRTSYKQRSSRKRSRSPYSSSSYTSDSDRSRSPHYRRSRSRSHSRRSSYRPSNNYVDRNVSQPAVEERRIVYVGRIEQETTKDMLRRKFLQYGTIKQISIHYKDTGMKYGFVTFERPQDAFNAIDNSTRDPQINMYDVSFGGRRAFCRASYADLDNAGINTYQSFVFPQQTQAPKEEDSFEALLLKMKAKLNANKASTVASPSATTTAVAAASSNTTATNTASTSKI